MAENLLLTYEQTVPPASIEIEVEVQVTEVYVSPTKIGTFAVEVVT
jgi:hypothetical protein